MRRRFTIALVAVVVLVAALGALNYFRPVPAVTPTASLPAQLTVPGTPPKIPWPRAGSAAVGVPGLGLIATSGNEKPVAAASVAKVMTALVILGDKPLQKDQSGPSITPSDLMALGMEAMKLDVFAQIVAMAQADLPVAGTVFNVDGVLGQSGIIGIKTGSGLADGANFLFAAEAPVDGVTLTVFGCVMGQPTLAVAFVAAKALIASMRSNLHVRRVIARNES